MIRLAVATLVLSSLAFDSASAGSLWHGVKAAPGPFEASPSQTCKVARNAGQ
jgi:hypothetical protein